ncbi:MAG: hypothetical protein WC151_07305 [Bacteroidales bacterium]
MKKLLVVCFLSAVVFLSGCNFLLPVTAMIFGLGFPKYRTTEESMAYYEKEIGLIPDFYAIPADQEIWDSLNHAFVVPHAKFFDHNKQEITYNSDSICMGRVMKFAAGLGDPNLPVAYKQDSLQRLLSRLKFIPEKVFDLAELGETYDYVMFLFWGEFIGKPTSKGVGLCAEAAANNTKASIAVIPVCLDANRQYFANKKEYRRVFVSIEK